MTKDEPFQMRELVDCIFYLNEFFDDMDKISFWMMTENPHLGNISPFDLFTRGRGHKVLAFVKNALEENKI